VGDYENAVKTQRRAVEQAPQYRVMRRQLELFEKALADETSASAGPASPDAPATGDEK
jgi:hypothetical protein